VAIFAFFFVPDYNSFSLVNTEYAITLAVMLLVSILISNLTSRIRYQARAAGRQERQTAALYAMSRNLTTKLSLPELLQEAVAQISRTFDSQVGIMLPDDAGRLRLSAGEPFPDDYGSEMLVANWVYRYGHFAGLGTKTLPKARGFYLPLRASQKMIGVLRLEPRQANKMIELKSLRFLEALGSQVALAIEREHLSQQAHQAQVQIEGERLRNALLSSVSHDLRTPLTVIAGSASSLLEGEITLDAPTKSELTQTIYEEANRLDRLVHNLLEMSRLQSGQTKLNQEWHVLEEVVGCALAQLEPQLQHHPVLIHLPPDLPMVRIDALLMERVFINLLENAIKYTPAQTPVTISGWITQQELLLEVADRGPGLAPGDEELVFEKFYQASLGSARGVGLGLTICRSIIEAHAGHIWAANRPGGGATFRFTLPLEAGAPLLDKSLPDLDKSPLDEAAHSAH
jgi:two-component system sensor histidine kinase KdpD